MTEEPARAKPRAPSRDRDGLHKRRGIWHYKLKIDGKWREFSTKTADYREAKKVRHEALQKQAQGRLPSDMARAKLSQVIEPWLAERGRLKSRNTWKTETHLTKPLLASLREKRLCDITGDDIRAYQVHRSADVNAKTVNRELRILKALLQRHRLWGPLADEYKRLRETSRGPGRALTDEQERKLFETAASRTGWDAAYYAGSWRRTPPRAAAN